MHKQWCNACLHAHIDSAKTTPESCSKADSTSTDESSKCGQTWYKIFRRGEGPHSILKYIRLTSLHFSKFIILTCSMPPISTVQYLGTSSKHLWLRTVAHSRYLTNIHKIKAGMQGPTEQLALARETGWLSIFHEKIGHQLLCSNYTMHRCGSA